MKVKRCFEPDCMLKVVYVCRCTSPGTFYCELHSLNHSMLPDKVHNLEPISIDSEAAAFTEENFKNSKLDASNDTSFCNSQDFSLNEELDLKMKSENVNTLKEKTERQSGLELNKDFKRTCSAYGSNALELPLMQTYQGNMNTYQQSTLLYNVKEEKKQSNLYIYNTVTESKEVKILHPPQPLDHTTSIALLPNMKLFCFGNLANYGFTMTIDMNFEFQVLPSGKSSRGSLIIYFNNNVYYFGGYDNSTFTWSSRFDLVENRWIRIASMPISLSMSSCIVFNRNILISTYNQYLLWYSIDIDSFSTMIYSFGSTRKVLINTNDRVYLIECSNKSIYESDVDNEYIWTKIADSTISEIPDQVYCSYNKEEVYIGCLTYLDLTCYKFDLKEKKLSPQIYCYR